MQILPLSQKSSPPKTRATNCLGWGATDVWRRMKLPIVARSSVFVVTQFSIIIRRARIRDRSIERLRPRSLERTVLLLEKRVASTSRTRIPVVPPHLVLVPPPRLSPRHSDSPSRPHLNG
eukprot:scaffold214833_cov34-Prasinocladus_malaysianus.AAC.1